MIASSFKVERIDNLGTPQNVTGSNSEKNLSSGIIQCSPLLEFLRGAGDNFCA